jgi:hypothetical protein
VKPTDKDDALDFFERHLEILGKALKVPEFAGNKFYLAEFELERFDGLVA